MATKENMVTIGEAKGASSHGWHKMSSFLECPKKYQYQELRGISRRLDQMPEPFTIGLVFHALRARWFANSFSTSVDNWQSLLEALEVAALDAPAPMAEEHKRKGLDLFQAYMEHYIKYPKPVPVACEYLLEAEISGHKFTARIDDVSAYLEAGGYLAIGEAKTSSDIAGTINEYTLHGQTLLQALLWSRAAAGRKLHGGITGVVLDIARKPYGKVGPKFVRQFCPLPESSLAWFEHTIVEARDRAMILQRHGVAWRNPTSCTRMQGRMRIECTYRDLCMHGKTAAGNYVIGDVPLNEWTPEYEGQEEPWK